MLPRHGKHNPRVPKLLVNIDVDDLEKAIRLYTEALGLRIGRRFRGEGAELLGAEAPICLLVKAPGTVPFAGASTKRDYRRHWSPVHLDFAVDDIEAAVTQAEAAGAGRESATTEHRWGREALMSDPFGHGFCLLQFNGRGHDEIAD